MRTIVRTWGNSLAIRIPREIAREIGIGDGSVVDLSIQEDAIVLAPVDDH
jgi:antitoxin MazE